MFLMERIISEFNRSRIHGHIQWCQRLLNWVIIISIKYSASAVLTQESMEFLSAIEVGCNTSWIDTTSIASSFYCTEELHWNSIAVTGSPHVLNAFECHRPSRPVMTRSPWGLFQDLSEAFVLQTLWVNYKLVAQCYLFSMSIRSSLVLCLKGVASMSYLSCQRLAPIEATFGIYKVCKNSWG